MTRYQFRQEVARILRGLASPETSNQQEAVQGLYNLAAGYRLDRDHCLRALAFLAHGTPEGRAMCCDILVGLVTGDHEAFRATFDRPAPNGHPGAGEASPVPPSGGVGGNP